MPTQADIFVWRGNTERVAVNVVERVAGVLQPVDIGGATLTFTATWAGGSMAKDLTKPDAPAGKAELFLTVAETRMIPFGRFAAYEIELRSGAEQKTILYGAVVADGGTNSDPA